MIAEESPATPDWFCPCLNESMTGPAINSVRDSKIILLMVLKCVVSFESICVPFDNEQIQVYAYKLPVNF